MKTLKIAILLFSINTHGAAQAIDSIFPTKNEAAFYTKTVALDSSFNKNLLFLNAKKWFANYYKSANAVIQLDDKENGVIIGKGNFDANYTPSALFGLNYTVTVRHVVEINVKDGKYKYEIRDFSGSYYASGTTIGSSYIRGSNVSMVLDNSKIKFGKKNILKFRNNCHKEIQLMEQSIQDAMSIKSLSITSQNKDW